MEKEQNNANNIQHNDQPLVSLVNLISDNLNKKNEQNKDEFSKEDNKDSNKNKKEDDILLEIDKIIGKEDINNNLDSSTNTMSETSSLNNKNYSSNKVEIKDNHFINKNGINPYDSYLNPFELTEETLNEPIMITIYRDLYLIYTKLKFVVNPFISNELKEYHIKQWDLWGPLLLIIFLACSLAINSSDKSQTFVLVFLIFWIGSFLVFANSYLLGLKTSIFQIFCLLGYCLFPLNIAAFILSFTSFLDLIRFIIIGLSCFWSLYSISSFLRNLSMPEQRYLVLYPSILLYIYISWFIFVNKH